MLHVDDAWALTLGRCIDDGAKFVEECSYVLLVGWVGSPIAPEGGVAEAELVVDQEEGCCVCSGDGRGGVSLGGEALRHIEG